MSSISAILIKCASAKSLNPSTVHKIHIQQTILGFFAPKWLQWNWRSVAQGQKCKPLSCSIENTFSVMCSLLFNHLQIHNKCIFYEFFNKTEKATPNYTVADCRVSNNHFQLMIFWFFFFFWMLLHFVPWTWWGYYYHYSLIHTLPSCGKATTQGEHLGFSLSCPMTLWWHEETEEPNLQLVNLRCHLKHSFGRYISLITCLLH